MDEFRYVGQTPTQLEGGRPIEPGEFTGPIDADEEHPHNKWMVDEGLLIPAAHPESEQGVAAAEAAVRAEQDEHSEDGEGQ